MKIHRHFILHKPYDCLSQFVNRQTKRKNKMLLSALGEFPENTMAIGRLDEKSEGLLLLTTDGKLSERVRSRSYEKEYFVQVDGMITEDKVEILRKGVTISMGKGRTYDTLPCSVHILSKDPGFTSRARKLRDDRHGPTSWISITLREGKFRQVRRMTASVGFPTLRLIRVRIGEIELGDLPSGAWKEVDITALI